MDTVNKRKNLTYTQRLLLEKLLLAGVHKKKIADLVGCSFVTVYAELKRGGLPA